MENENNRGYGRDGFSSQDGQAKNFDSQQYRDTNAGHDFEKSRNENISAPGSDSEDFTSQYSDNNRNFEDTENDALEANVIDSDELEDDDDFEDDDELEDEEDFEDDELEDDQENQSDDLRTPGL